LVQKLVIQKNIAQCASTGGGIINFH